MLKERAAEQYCPRDMRKRLEKVFLELKQGDMTVGEYEAEFEKKSRFASRHIPDENERIEMFLDGLRYEIRDFVNMREMPTFSKAVEFARKREHDLEIRGVITPGAKRAKTEHSGPTQSSNFRRFNSNKKSKSHGASRAQSQSQSFSIQVVRILSPILVKFPCYVNITSKILCIVGCSSRLPTMWQDSQRKV